MTRTTTKPVTFRNDGGRIHAGVNGEDFTLCGRRRNARNAFTVQPGTATVTCGACLSQLERGDHVREAGQRLDRRMAGSAVKSDPQPLRNYLPSAAYPGVVWPL